MIEVTSVKFFTPPENFDNAETMGICTIELDDYIRINRIEFCKSELNGKYYISYPHRYNKLKNKNSSLCNPFNKEQGDSIYKTVMEEFDKWICRK